MGFLSGAGAAAVLIFSLFAGAWVDRRHRRPILIGRRSRARRGAGHHPAGSDAAPADDGRPPPGVASSTLSVLFDVSYQAYLPSLIERENLLAGNSRLALTESIAQIAGPGIAGTLVQLITAPMALLFDAVSFVCSAISVWLIRKREPMPTRTREAHIGREISEGLGASWRDPLLRALAGRKATSAFFSGFGSSLYFLFVTRELGLTAALFRSVRMAPLYDAATTRVLPKLKHDRLALKLNGKDDNLRRTDFIALATTAGLRSGDAEAALDSIKGSMVSQRPRPSNSRAKRVR